jgi:hypothetical protein
MERLLSQAEFQSQDLRNLGELVDRGVRPTVFKVGQTTERDPGEFGEIALTKTEHSPSKAEFLPDFLVRQGALLLSKRIIVRFSTLFSRIDLSGSRNRISMRFLQQYTQKSDEDQAKCAT